MRKPYGSVHHLTTANGSQLTVDSRRDEFGRGSSHVVTGLNPAGYSAYFARNVSAREVARVVRVAEAHRWTRITASVEGF